jgi:hypothetical protein
VRALLVVAVLTTAAHAAPEEDDISPRTIVFARGDKLIMANAWGKSESELATLPAKSTVRALRSDSRGTVLLADVNGKWSWMPMDGSSKTLSDLPCEVGPAHLSNDGTYVMCRGKTGSTVVNLKSGKITPIDVPTAGARLVGSGTELRLVWADNKGVWSAVPPARKQPKKVAPEAPLRALTVSPDGTRALGVYTDEVFDRARNTKPADVLSVFALDGTAARRKVIHTGVPLEWSHDGKWVLVQDGRSACTMLAVGGQYKCWRGYTAAAISQDGKYALLFGNRDMPKETPKKKKKATKKKGKAKGKGKAKPKQVEPEDDAGPEGEPSGEAEQPEDAPLDEAADDVPLPPPGGPVALYRAELNGPYTKSPKLITRDVAGAAVWIPVTLPPPAAQ